MFELIVDQTTLDSADDALLECVRSVVDARGGVAERIGGVELVLISKHRFDLIVHCEGFPPPLPGAPADG
jgi:hypothetical protein